jgi:hypothetical protein
MAESCPGTTYVKLAWLQAWHIRDETYSTALADLVNPPFRHLFAKHWVDDTTSTSDRQIFRTNHLKTASARRTRARFADHLASFYHQPLFWHRAYFVGSVGAVTLGTVRTNVEAQGTGEHARQATATSKTTPSA